MITDRLKYRKRKIDLMLGIVYLILGMFFLTASLFAVWHLNGDVYFVLILIMGGIACTATTYLYLGMYNGKRDYIIIEQDIIYKDRGLVRSKLMLPIAQIKQCKKMGEKIRIEMSLKHKSETIYLDCLNIDDIKALESKLELNR